jgi:hypothetical protein
LDIYFDATAWFANGTKIFQPFILRAVSPLSGSKSAGIITFIREHLVDLGEDPHVPTGSDSPDIEAQTPPEVGEVEEAEDIPIPAWDHEKAQTYSKFRPGKSGYCLDEIPLMDVDLWVRL